MTTGWTQNGNIFALNAIGLIKNKSTSIKKIMKKESTESIEYFQHVNDNLTSVLLAGPAVLPLAKSNFDILVLPDGPILRSIAFSDASRCSAKKKR